MISYAWPQQFELPINPGTDAAVPTVFGNQYVVSHSITASPRYFRLVH
ncbi:MAG TPA: hypothetical protein VNU68_33245 [Verrucomicrobiae bacterium]|nr:hypothetical protein [Verrucomicrobiae bacterium]